MVVLNSSDRDETSEVHDKTQQPYRSSNTKAKYSVYTKKELKQNTKKKQSSTKFRM